MPTECCILIEEAPNQTVDGALRMRAVNYSFEMVGFQWVFRLLNHQILQKELA